MALRVYKFMSIDTFEWFLRGGIIGGLLRMNSESAPGLFGLVGETATFTLPSASVTFVAGADPSGYLTFAEIKTQIEAAVAGIIVSLNNGRLHIIESTPTNGVDIGSAGAQLARAILGFNGSAGAHTKGRVINPLVGHAAPTTPYLVQLVSANNDSYTAVIME
jgi:hypothetical protein